MNEKDRRVRRQWFGLLLLNVLISIGTSLIQMQKGSALKHMPQFRYLVFSISVLASVACGYLLYHCIYKKLGTKLLTVVLILTIFSSGANIFLYLSGKMTFPDPVSFYIPYAVIMQILSLWWLVLCWKILQINKRLKQSSPIV